MAYITQSLRHFDYVSKVGVASVDDPKECNLRVPRNVTYLLHLSVYFVGMAF